MLVCQLAPYNDCKLSEGGRKGKKAVSELLKVSVPESSPTLDFVSGTRKTLAVVACAAWERSANAFIRDGFRDDLHDRIQGLMASDKIGLHGRSHGFMIDLVYRYRSVGDFPEGFGGLSAVLVDDGRSPGTAVPYAYILNYIGKTGIYVPPKKLDDASGPYNAYFSDDDGLFSLPEERKGYNPADMHTLLFHRHPAELYVGLRDQLVSMRRDGALAPRSHAHGSIIVPEAKKSAADTAPTDYPARQPAFHPVDAD